MNGSKAVHFFIGHSALLARLFGFFCFGAAIIADTGSSLSALKLNMHPNRVAENVFGTLGTICWTAQLVPQVWKSYREKSTEGLSEWLVLCWGLAGGFFGVYAVVQDLNIPLILQPEIFAFLCLVSWGQCQYYSSTRPKYISFIIAVITIALLGGFEAGMVFAIRPSLNPRAIQFFGIFSSVLLATGLVTQYYEIYQRKEVVGLSITFMVVDCLGGVFSDLSLAFKSEFDTIAAVTYTLVIVMDGMVLLAAAILNPRARKRRERLQEAQDNVPHDNPSEISAIPLTTSQRRSSANSEHRGGLPAE